MKIHLKFKDILDSVSISFKRFPLALIFATLSVLVLIIKTHSDPTMEDIYVHMAMTLALGIPMALSLHVYFEGRGPGNKSREGLAYIGLIGILILYHLSLSKNLDMVNGSRFISFNISFYLIFSFIPFLHRRQDYEIYMVKLFSRLEITYLYSFILYLGLAAILATINLLFNANLGWQIFYDIAIIIAGIFTPAFFLSDVARRDEEFFIEDYPRVLEALLQYIIMPLLSIYTIILYVYFAKSILTMELPQGVMAHLVLWYSIISSIILFFIYPLKEEKPWIKSFMKFFPKLILPLLIMMFVAMGIRIGEYGITENRYFVLAVGLWVTGFMIYYAIKDQVANIILVISLVIIGLVSVIGPINAYSMGQLSQNNRLKNILLENNMLDKEMKIVKTDGSISEIDKREISEIILYFDGYYDLKKIKYLPDDFRIDHMEEIFGFELTDKWQGNYKNNEYFNYYRDEDKKLWKIEDFDYLIIYSSYDSQKTKEIRENHSIFFDEDNGLTIEHNNDIIYENNLKDVIEKIHKDNRQGDGASLSYESMSFTDENQHIKIQIDFKTIAGYERDLDTIEVTEVEYYIFIEFR